MAFVFSLANKDHFYDVLTRSGYYLPSKSFCDVEYLDGVMHGLRWAPMHAHVKLRPCPLPPPKRDVLIEVERLLRVQKMPALTKVNSKSQPDLRFLLTALATLQPDHFMFNRDY